MNTSATAQTIQLRPYQQQMVGELYAQIKAGDRRLLLIALMGLGKTVIAAWIMRDAVSTGKRCVFLVPLVTLVDQTLETLEALGVHCTALQGAREVDASAPVIVASLQTIASRLNRGQSLQDILGPVDIVFGDEAHVTSFHSRYGGLEEWMLSNNGHTIGMTATPWRLSKKQWLGQKFDRVIVGPQPPEAIKLGAVVPCRGFRMGEVFDLETLKVKSTGDYSEGDMSAQATTDEALEHVVAEWQRIANGRPTMMVGSTVIQAEMTASAFEKAGIATATITGETPMVARQVIFERVKRGEVKVICSVGCLTAGFNLPCISCILYVRATKSKSLFFQTAGRGSRPAPGKHDFLLLDFGGNLKRFGSPMAEQDYCIDEPPREEVAPPTKGCPECGAEVSMFAAVCPECGYIFNDGDDDYDEDEDLTFGELHEFVDAATKEKIAFIRTQRRVAWLDRTSPDAPVAEFVEAYGHQPPAVWLHRSFLQRRKISQTQLNKFLGWLEDSYKGQKQWERQWMSYHLSQEFGTDDLGTVVTPEWHETLALPVTASWEDAREAYRLQMQQMPDANQAGMLNSAIADARNVLPFKHKEA